MTAAAPSFSPLAFAERADTRSAQPPLPLADLQRAVAALAELPLPRARTLPAAAYTSEEFFDWEVGQLLRGDWQCVAHVSQIPRPGDFLNLDLLGEPLIVVRGKEGAVRVLSRVCPHRAMDIMPAGFGYEGHGPAEARPEAPGCGHTRIFLCPYHAWTFELDGRLKACPEMQEAEGFARDDFALKSFRSEVWQGFVFVNLDSGAVETPFDRDASVAAAAQLVGASGHLPLTGGARCPQRAGPTGDVAQRVGDNALHPGEGGLGAEIGNCGAQAAEGASRSKGVSTGAAPPLAADLGAMAEDLAAFRLADLQLVVAREWDCPFNWKALVENFMESYHHLGIHHKTLQPMMPARDTWTEEERRRYVRAHLPYRDSVAADYRAFEARGDFSEQPPPLPGLDDVQKSEWGLFLVPPTFLLATAPDRVIWYRLQPLGPSRLRLLTTVLVAPEIARRDNFPYLREKIAQQLTEFHLEDMEVCTAVQRGLYASGWQQGRLSHLEMTVWLFHRFLAARLRGVWPTDDRPAAPSQRP